MKKIAWRTCSFSTFFQSVEIMLPPGRAQRGHVNRNRNTFNLGGGDFSPCFSSPSSGQKPNQQFAEAPEEIWIPIAMEMHCSWILGLCGCSFGSLCFSEQDLGFYPRVCPQGLLPEQHLDAAKPRLAGWISTSEVMQSSAPGCRSPSYQRKCGIMHIKARETLALRAD